MDRTSYCASFDEVRCGFERDVEKYGLAFESCESQSRDKRLNDAWDCENGGCSMRRGWISPACEACRTGLRTATFFVSLKCTRSCWFCFNPNQRDYERFLHEERDIASELRAAHERGFEYDCLAVTGGEPFLHQEKVLDFLHVARELYPKAHLRIYTCGDMVDEPLLERLRDAGLDELRFSVKLDDDFEIQGHVLTVLAQAVKVLPSVVVEMPAFPGSLSQMKELLLRLDEAGVSGINLLELCFPLHNAEAFAQRGLKLRKRPYRVLYDYWYGGGIPVAGSEAVALELLSFAAKSRLSMGVHYCSSDNKNTGQLFQQNVPFLNGGALTARHAYLGVDTRDYCLKCAKAFGAQAKQVAAILESMTVDNADVLSAADELCDEIAFADGVAIENRWRYDAQGKQVLFPLTWVDAVCAKVDGVELAVSYNVLETGADGAIVREVDCIFLEEEDRMHRVLEGVL